MGVVYRRGSFLMYFPYKISFSDFMWNWSLFKSLYTGCNKKGKVNSLHSYTDILNWTVSWTSYSVHIYLKLHKTNQLKMLVLLFWFNKGNCLKWNVLLYNCREIPTNRLTFINWRDIFRQCEWTWPATIWIWLFRNYGITHITTKNVRKQITIEQM